jgi:glycogen debranching enzyme
VSVKTHFDQWKSGEKTHKGIPSELVAVKQPEIRTGQDDDGEYSEIVVPDEFAPGSIMVFSTDMDVSAFLPRTILRQFHTNMARRLMS